MSQTKFPWVVRSLAFRARVEAYVGLLLLVLGLIALTFGHCPRSNGSPRPRPLGVSLRVRGEKVPPTVEYGNALNDGISRQGWWVGHFMKPDSPRYSSQVETKWISHPKGRNHGVFSTNKIATSMAVLISGKHRIDFEKAHVLLEHPGDYVIWGPGVPHSWLAIEDSTMLCIRWPSIGGDQEHTSGGVSGTHAGTKFQNESTAQQELTIGISRNNSNALNGRLLAAS